MRFNTDNGIRRATMYDPKDNIISLSQFQYRQRYQEGYNSIALACMSITSVMSFNTDNGIRRATIGQFFKAWRSDLHVSIPTTVSGGLQCEYFDEFFSEREFQYRQRYQEGYNWRWKSLRLFWHRFQYRQRYQEGYNVRKVVDTIGSWSSFQYRQRYQEGYNQYD